MKGSRASKKKIYVGRQVEVRKREGAREGGSLFPEGANGGTVVIS